MDRATFSGPRLLSMAAAAHAATRTPPGRVRSSDEGCDRTALRTARLNLRTAFVRALTVIGALHVCLVLAGQAHAGADPDSEPNEPLLSAQNVDSSFTLNLDVNIENSAGYNTSEVIPHVEIVSLGDGSVTTDFYSFTVSHDDVIILDIDCGEVADAYCSSLSSIDSFITLYNPSGVPVAFNDDGETLTDTGTVGTFDSFLELIPAPAGLWTVEVSVFPGDAAIPVGGDYVLNISVGPQVPGSDCCIDNGTPGCDDASCEGIVCALDSYCCNTAWDGICADLANSNCGNLCLVTSPAELQSKVPFGPRQTIVSGIGSPQRVTTADLDGDGDIDVLAAFLLSDRWAWYENIDGAGTFALGQMLSTTADGARGLIGTDLDGDGDLDLAATSQYDDVFAWFENTDGAGTFGPQNTINMLHDVAAGLAAADLDRDGDNDLLVCSLQDDELAWYENDGAASFNRFVISNTTDRCVSIATADVDGDGDLDVIANQQDDDEVTWYENQLNEISNDFGLEQQIASVTSPSEVVAADIDGDGDADVLSASQAGSMVAWYPNTNATWGVVITIATGPSGRLSVGDVDADGDLDVISYTQSDDRFEWYENLVGDGTVWTPHLVSTEPNFPVGAVAADLDGDGDLDLISLSSADSTIGWYENLTIHRSAALPADSLITSGAAGAQRPAALDLVDVDRDGDLDVLAAAFIDGQISWFENDNGDGTSWTDARIATGVSVGATGVRGADINRDGFIDVVSIADNGLVRWHENDGTPGGLGDWAEYIIDTSALQGKHVDVGDINGDGAPDVASAATSGNLAWYVNVDNGNLWAEYVIAKGVSGAHWIELADIDRDGFLDAVYLSQASNTFGWYRNDGTPLVGDWGASHTIGSPVSGTAASLRVVDVDGDGLLDIVAASQVAELGQVVWFHNDGTPAVGDWGVAHPISTSSLGFEIIDVFDVDLDGDLDVLAPAASGNVVWFEHPEAGPFSTWTEHIVSTVSTGQPVVVAGGDIDGDGDPDLVVGDVFFADPLDPGNRFAWLENRGGQFALPTTTPGTSLLEGTSGAVLSIDVDHKGRTGDTDLELTSIELRLEDDLGIGLTSMEADALFSRVSLYADDGSSPGEFDGTDTELVFRESPFSLSPGGGTTLPSKDDYPEYQVFPGTVNRYFVVLTTQSDAASQTPHLFQVVHVTEASSSADDRDHDLPLSLEFLANTTTAVIGVLDPASDDDMDGLLNADEINTHLTDPLDSDTDDDGVSDGDEINLYTGDPLDADTDDDGLEDGAELILGTKMTDPDHDHDDICDGGGTGGGSCTAGPDNCPFVDNTPQVNSDVFDAGDACQCGDVTGDGVMTTADVDEVREVLMGVAVFANPGRCDVTGTPDCGVDDIFALERAANGLSVNIQNSCAAFFGP